MTGITQQQLWKRLQEAGLVTGELSHGSGSPWYIRTMMGCAGWIGAFFLLAFIGTAFVTVMQDAAAATFASLLCCGAAYAVFRAAPRNDFSQQFGLAMGVTGQILAGVAVYKDFSFNDPTGHFLFLCVELALTICMPNFSHRVFTTLGAATALFFGLFQAGLQGVALPLVAAGCAGVWRCEIRLSERVAIWRPVGYGLALGMIQIAAMERFSGIGGFLASQHEAGWLRQHGPMVGTLLTAVVFIAVVADILKEMEQNLDSTEGKAAILCALLLMALTIPAHGLAAALLLVVLGFAAANRVLGGLGLLALVSFLAHYYYSMHETLLFKSAILLATGATLLAARYLIGRLFPAVGGNNA
jgi:hypothetical protein